MSEYVIFTECCIRESGLGKDTTGLRKEIKEYKNEISILLAEQKADNQIIKDEEAQLVLLQKAIDDTRAKFAAEQKRNKIYKKILWFTSSLATLSAGILVTEIMLHK